MITRAFLLILRCGGVGLRASDKTSKYLTCPAQIKRSVSVSVSRELYSLEVRTRTWSLLLERRY
jgi:hypothetical protein